MVNFVILCGGSGSRLWPKSREKLPKQLLQLTNENTMFQNTVLRINKIENYLENNVHTNKLIVICNKEHAHIIETQLENINHCMDYQIISEPKGRDSAPAICISALLGLLGETTIILPCDHIFDDEEFAKCVVKSLEYVDKSIVTFGIKPTGIETGYGYIQIDDDYNTIKFVEKPNYDTAKKYFEEGSYLWNAGIFVFKNKNMLQCFQKYALDIYENCIQTIENTNITSKIVPLSETPFLTCRAISVDYAIMEKLCNDSDIQIKKCTILYNSLWNDIGSYLALYEELNKNNKENNNISNNDNNVLKGDVITIKFIGMNMCTG